MKIYRKILPLLRHWLKLLWCSSRFSNFPALAFQLRFPTLSDNTGAEAVSNKLFTTNLPLALFLEKLCLLISTSHVEVEVNHIPGKDNTYADALSRWTNSGDPPCTFSSQRPLSNFSFRPCGNLTGCRDSFPHQHGFLGNFQGRSC